MRIPLLFCLTSLTLLGQPVEFNRDIRPILSDRCFACHGPDAATRKTKLRFDLESAARPAIVPGDPDHSKLYQRISSPNPASRMPPSYSHKEPLTPAQISLLRTWIEQGAKWQPFWSFIPPRKPALPPVSQPAWPRNPIDYFILSRLDREGLHPSPEAAPEALIRRVTLDLTGLPPTPSEVDAFVADPSPAAYEHLVDRLLASPRYGERMAFRWMEAARYGDTNGYQTDGERDMWRWRDWVIDAFNRNMPYDQFTVEQLAGDLLPHPTRDQLIATGFNRNQRTTGEGGIIPEEYRVEYVADRAQTTSIVWLGLTTGCARCHDHKFDPISQKDFYRLFAYFNRIPNERGFAWNYGNEEPLIKAPIPEQEQTLQRMDAGIARAQAQFDALQPQLREAQDKWEQKLLKSKSADWLPTESLVFHNDPVERFDGKRFLEFTSADLEKDLDLGYMQPFTFAAWVKPDSNDAAILSHSDDYFEGSGHGLYILDGKIRLHLIFRWTDLGIRVQTAPRVKLHEWQHVAVTYDGKRRAAGVRIFIDGQPVETEILFDQNNEPLKKKDTPFRIGAGGGKRFEGEIGSVRVYRAALTPREIAVLVEKQTISQIAAIPTATRTEAQRDKLAFCFLYTAAPEKIRTARLEIYSLQAARDTYYAAVPTVMIMADSPQPRQTFVLKRGAYDDPGEPVSPGVPEVLPPFRPEWPNNRLGLARWLVDPSNPLTARVTVNRFWQSFFGTGIVKTVDDFGSQGEWPVHPELLDWLATDFVSSGWNVKALVKTIVMSAAYRQSSKVTPELLERDPENRLLARGPRYRLGPEVIRDQALFVSGLLVEKLGGPSVKPYQPAGLWQELAGGKGYIEDQGEGLYRRSLYTYWKRTVVPPFMANFDSPNREQCSVFENRTNSPLQALELMNDVTFLEASRKLAERMMVEGGSTPEQRLAFGYRLVLAKTPDPARLQILEKALTQFSTASKTDAREFLHEGRSPQAAKVKLQDLAAYTAVASLLLNLDETITKE
jgi:Protein of unknown function (DUF1553)/Protein of unknown function (DUF1549)/Concanavalin A-like lectin/glucanases superfamily/Planctomycete cytochrome C